MQNNMQNDMQNNMQNDMQNNMQNDMQNKQNEIENMQEWKIENMAGIRIGNAQDPINGTGVTVVYFTQGANAGIRISGGGPASRETPLLSPYTADNRINALVISGGSAYGLAASDGVMKCLENNEIGYDTGYARIPLVVQSSIYDLGYKNANVRPDAVMGYKACEAALCAPDSTPDSTSVSTFDSTFNRALAGVSFIADMPFEERQNLGAACGATISKMPGVNRPAKTGIGTYAVKKGELEVAALVVVNAFGDVVNPSNGKVVLGLADEDGYSLTRKMLMGVDKKCDLFTGNTTIGIVVTNAKFSKSELAKIASMTENAYARCIHPVGTMADGDTIYAASTGNLEADINMVGSLASYVMEKAILHAAGM